VISVPSKGDFWVMLWLFKFEQFDDRQAAWLGCKNVAALWQVTTSLIGSRHVPLSMEENEVVRPCTE